MIEVKVHNPVHSRDVSLVVKVTICWRCLNQPWPPLLWLYGFMYSETLWRWLCALRAYIYCYSLL